MRYIVGTNLRGYLPTNEPFEHDSWEDAQQDLLEEIAFDLDGAEHHGRDAVKRNELQDAWQSVSEHEPGAEIEVVALGRVYWLHVER